MEMRCKQGIVMTEKHGWYGRERNRSQNSKVLDSFRNFMVSLVRQTVATRKRYKDGGLFKEPPLLSTFTKYLFLSNIYCISHGMIADISSLDLRKARVNNLLPTINGMKNSVAYEMEAGLLAKTFYSRRLGRCHLDPLRNFANYMSLRI